MAHLFTNHDPYHIHKTIGLLCLLHYLYRFLLFFVYGQAFGRDGLWVEVACVTLHAVLSLSSLLLPLPQGRNHAAPMIWAEFRLHSIVFACRHVFFTVFYLLDGAGSFDGIVQTILQDPSASHVFSRDFDPAHTTTSQALLSCTVKGLFLVAVCHLANRVTNTLGDKSQRTTNSMAYPESVTLEDRSIVKKLYAQRQFYATVWCMYGSPLLAFSPVLAIQIAPLMMTFVRKGIISAIWYHRWYALSLQVCYFVISALYLRAAFGAPIGEPGLVFEGNHLSYIMFYGMMTALVTREFCRFYLQLSPSVVWFTNVFLGVFAFRTLLETCGWYHWTSPTGNAGSELFGTMQTWFSQHVMGQAEASWYDWGALSHAGESATGLFLGYKAWFHAQVIDQGTGAINLAGLGFIICAARIWQMTVYSTWQFSECLGLTRLGWRNWDSDRFVCRGAVNFPRGLLFGEFEYFSIIAVLFAVGFSPTAGTAAAAVGCYAAFATALLYHLRHKAAAPARAAAAKKAC
ncbi:hypothetical protein DIPPA_06800 [Diplonema papillatum]|nr:hypothetical protein DIPPA_06800 [Diplonema papillatum]